MTYNEVLLLIVGIPFAFVAIIALMIWDNPINIIRAPHFFEEALWLFSAFVAPFRVLFSKTYRERRYVERDYDSKRKFYLHLFLEFLLAFFCMALLAIPVFLVIFIRG